jgi:hypothetical protein
MTQYAPLNSQLVQQQAALVAATTGQVTNVIKRFFCQPENRLERVYQTSLSSLVSHV